jgi:hypothetical protein
MHTATSLAVTPLASRLPVVSRTHAARSISSYAHRPTWRFMASEASKETAFLGTFSNKSGSENANSQTTVNAEAQDGLQRSRGEDHTVSHRHRLSLRQYPADCPPVRVRWFYAVDSPKWKPSLSDQKRENPKPLPQPKKFVPFTPKDSQSVEQAFQNLCNTETEREQAHYNQPVDRGSNEPVKVPVNEDNLFDVNINRRELGPSYWLGPVYEVRRGTWFFQEGSTIRPCEENLATQLEEGYLKVKPWRSENINQPLAQPLPASNGREQGTLAWPVTFCSSRRLIRQRAMVIHLPCL